MKQKTTISSNGVVKYFRPLPTPVWYRIYVILKYQPRLTLFLTAGIALVLYHLWVVTSISKASAQKIELYKKAYTLTREELAKVDSIVELTVAEALEENDRKWMVRNVKTLIPQTTPSASREKPRRTVTSLKGCHKFITKKEYLKHYAVLAIEEGRRTGVAPSIYLGQAFLEAGIGVMKDGLSTLVTEHHNHFSVKCRECTKAGYRKKGHNCVNYHDNSKKDYFRKWSDIEEAYANQSKLYLSERYRGVVGKNYKRAAKILRDQGYAYPKGKYDQKLVDVIERNGLQKFDAFAKP